SIDNTKIEQRKADVAIDREHPNGIAPTDRNAMAGGIQNRIRCNGFGASDRDRAIASKSDGTRVGQSRIQIGFGAIGDHTVTTPGLREANEPNESQNEPRAEAER